MTAPSDPLPDPMDFYGKCRACSTALVDLDTSLMLHKHVQMHYVLELRKNPITGKKESRGGTLLLCHACYTTSLRALGLDLDALLGQLHERSTN